MHIVFASKATEENADIAQLDVAWDRPETFALVPDRGRECYQWVQLALSQLPAEYWEGAFALLTSGSTGEPKLVVGLRNRAEQLVHVLNRLQNSAEVMETILVLPLSYSYAFVNQWLWSRVFDCRCVATHGLGHPDEIEATLCGAESAMLCLVGIQVPVLLRHFTGRSFPGVVRLHFAGGRFPQERLQELRQLFPCAQIYNNYGCAEAMPRLTLRLAEDSEDPRDVGWPLPGVEIRSDNDGELLFRSPYGAVGYVGQSGFVPINIQSWVGTGDLGHETQQKSWQLVGRKSEVFKRHGEKISLPSLLTTVAKRWQGQAAFYCESDASGEQGHVLVLAPQPSPERVRAILNALRAEYSRSHWPLRIEGMTMLPLLSSGKINTAAIASVSDKQVYWYQRI